MAPKTSPKKYEYFSFPPYPSPKKAQRMPSAKARVLPFLKPTYAKAQASVDKAAKGSFWPFAKASGISVAGALKAPLGKPTLSAVTVEVSAYPREGEANDVFGDGGPSLRHSVVAGLPVQTN